MKKTTATAIVISDNKAIRNFCELAPVRAKEVLFAMSILQGDERLSDSPIEEVRLIANQYDGVIQSKFAKELAAKLAKAYSEKYPKTLLTKKELSQYTDCRYRKLLDAVGEYGFDYVVTMLRQHKVYMAANPDSGIDEYAMLAAMRWVERRENTDHEASNEFHRRKGLELVGFGKMAKYLVKHSFVIANVYEMVAPSNATVDFPVKETINAEQQKMTVREIKIHFLEEAELIAKYYASHEPEVPEGYAEDELVEGSITYALAKKNKLNDSEAVIAYVERLKRFNELREAMSEVFEPDELEFIQQNTKKVKALISNYWE